MFLCSYNKILFKKLKFLKCLKYTVVCSKPHKKEKEKIENRKKREKMKMKKGTESAQYLPA